ncbi:DUF5629 family protein [Pseudomonas sp. 2FG]|uniref:DUF5629 family protein n=1 Tax=Pseudomonas sp. 2FG TaxID=2502191 RepID=UPI0010F9E6E7|nr:DUF5629 family protein [Pseudomonas sp. 2FG]
MTTPDPSLLAALATADMLEIDGLYAWQFELGTDTAAPQLSIEAMDGSSRRLWRFSHSEVQAATFDPASQSWTLVASSGEHRLKCLAALVADNSDEDL